MNLDILFFIGEIPFQVLLHKGVYHCSIHKHEMWHERFILRHESKCFIDIAVYAKVLKHEWTLRLIIFVL